MWTWFFTVHCIQRDFYEYILECHPFSVYLNSMTVKWTSTWKFEYLSLMLHNHSGPGLRRGADGKNLANLLPCKWRCSAPPLSPPCDVRASCGSALCLPAAALPPSPGAAPLPTRRDAHLAPLRALTPGRASATVCVGTLSLWPLVDIPFVL